MESLVPTPADPVRLESTDVRLLIDGNNLLHAAAAEEPERPPSRHKLCELLGRWSARTRRPVHVVFDGPEPAPGLLRQMAELRVELTFSGKGVSADDCLKKLISANTAPRLLVVVSTDHEVARAAQHRRCHPARAADFWKRVLRDLSRPDAVNLEPPEKREGLRDAEVEDWIREMNLEG
jgi:predicted RNA-binding protein with PIN domain